MNLGEAITNVLRNRGQSLLQDFLREDLAGVIGGVISDGAKLFRGSREGVKSVRIRTLPGEIAGSANEIAQLIRVLPGRLRKGISEFQKDLLVELQKRDAKEKTLFCLKLFGILTSSTFSTLYNVRMTGRTFSLGSVKLRSAFAKFLLGELILRALRLFALRFVGEVEKLVTSKEDLEHLSYFKSILDHREASSGPVVTRDDPAFKITEKLRKIILNGDDES